MTRLSEAAKRIGALRKTLRMDRQQDLANAVGVAVTPVSAWERGEYEPSAENYIILGNLAAKAGLFGDARWFWKEAGLDEKVMLLAVAETLKAKPPEVIAALLSKLPTKTRWLRVDEKSTSLAFAPGDIVVLDESDNGAPDLQPFWNRIVLVDLGRRADRQQGSWDYLYPDGLIFGKLSFDPYPGRPNDLLWAANLVSLNPGSTEGLVLGFWGYKFPPEVKIGMYGLPEVPREVPEQIKRKMELRKNLRGAVPADEEIERALGEADYAASRKSQDILEKARVEAGRQAPSELRIKGFRILGRVIAWFAAPGAEKK